MNKNLISIIVPVYNAERFLEATIETVINQSYKHWELLLINDGSTDNSKLIAQKYLNEKIKWIDLKQNSGAAIARNEGIIKSKGEFLCFLDADDFWDKDKLRKQVCFMKKNNCAFSFTGYEFVNEKGIPKSKKVYVPKQLTYSEALKNTTIWTCTVMFNMKILSKEDILMPNVESEDTACWWKVLKKVECAYGYNEILSYYRRSSGTLSSNKLVAIKRIWNLYRSVERLSIIYSIYNFIFYSLNAIKRRM